MKGDPMTPTRRVFMEDIERMTGWKHETLKHYRSTATRARSEGTATDKHMPEHAERVRVTQLKADGRPLVVWKPYWYMPDIIAWLDARGTEYRPLP